MHVMKLRGEEEFIGASKLEKEGKGLNGSLIAPTLGNAWKK